MRQEFFTRYAKDDYRVRDVIGTFYDTAGEELAAKRYKLRVRQINRIKVADLKVGFRSPEGWFQGQQWLCSFGGPHRVLQQLEERGAPHIELSGTLSPTRTFVYKRYAATLYMPDQLRAELSFDVAEDGGARLGIELLYGAGAELLNFIDELRKEFEI
jgi:inorganic triphosphatase YgiF